jgi:hypothetical protein
MNTKTNTPMKTAIQILLLATTLLTTANGTSAAEPTGAVEAAALSPAVHMAITTTRDFLSAVGTGDFDRAGKLVLPERFPKDKLQKLKDSLVVEGAKVQEAHLGQEQAAVITDAIPPRQEGGGRTGRWGVSLRKQGQGWLIRDMDFLPNEQAVERYLAGFRKGEPNAEKVVIAK